MIDHALWKNRVYDAIRSISDLEFQHRAWLGGGPEVSSFVETICTLYDDCLFIAFLQDPTWQQLGLSEHIRADMELLRQMIDHYKEPETGTDAAILADPQWHVIVQQAQRVILNQHLE